LNLQIIRTKVADYKATGLFGGSSKTADEITPKMDALLTTIWEIGRGIEDNKYALATLDSLISRAVELKAGLESSGEDAMPLDEASVDAQAMLNQINSLVVFTDGQKGIEAVADRTASELATKFTVLLSLLGATSSLVIKRDPGLAKRLADVHHKVFELKTEYIEGRL
jgi:hypothetical protein